MSQTPRYGWIPELPELLVPFTHSKRQVQDFQPFLNKKIPACVLHHLQVPYHPPLQVYFCMNGLSCLVPSSGVPIFEQLPSHKAFIPPHASATCCMCGVIH